MMLLCLSLLASITNAAFLYHLGAYAQGRSHGDQFVGYCGSRLSQDSWAMQAFVD